jgi:F-type H+-transporting ATPase subunit b
MTHAANLAANLGRALAGGLAVLLRVACQHAVAGSCVAASLLAAFPAAASDDLNLTPDVFITTILLVAFVAIMFPLNSLIFRPLLQIMDEREDKITGARRRAASIEAQATEALSRYEDALRVAREEAMQERRAQLEAARADLLTTTRRAKAEAAQELENVREELDASLRDARETLRDGSEELARLAAERILGRSLS